jgi:hypothetical protein
LSVEYHRASIAYIIISLFAYWLLTVWSTLLPGSPIAPGSALAEVKQLLIPIIGIQAVILVGRVAYKYLKEIPLTQKVIVFVPLPLGASQEMLPLLLEPDDLQIYNWMKTHGHTKTADGGLKIGYKGDPVFYSIGEHGSFRINGERCEPVAIKVLAPKN